MKGSFVGKIVIVYRNQELFTTDTPFKCPGVVLRGPSWTFVVIDFGLPARRYNPLMSLSEQIQKDIVTAMKARDEHRLSTLRMVKTALKNREVEKMAPLDDKEGQQVLTTLIKQRMDSVEQFTKGGR